MSVHNYTVKKWIINKWITLYGKVPRCKNCNKEFKVGDKIEAKHSGEEGTRRFHLGCMASVPKIPRSKKR